MNFLLWKFSTMPLLARQSDHNIRTAVSAQQMHLSKTYTSIANVIESRVDFYSLQLHLDLKAYVTQQKHSLLSAAAGSTLPNNGHYTDSETKTA